MVGNARWQILFYKKTFPQIAVPALPKISETDVLSAKVPRDNFKKAQKKHKVFLKIFIKIHYFNNI